MQTQPAILYSFPSCNSSRRVKNWLTVNRVEHVERRILRDTLLPNEIMQMLKLSKMGFDEIISSRIESIGKSIVDFEDLPTSKFIRFVCENPTVLRKPILILGNQLIVGWNRELFREIATKQLV